MQFREFAAAETSALLRRLMTSRAEHSKRELQAVRRAFETAMRTVEDKLGAAAPADDAISALVEKLAAAATTEIDNAAKRTRAEGQAALDAALETARAEHADALKAEQQKPPPRRRSPTWRGAKPRPPANMKQPGAQTRNGISPTRADR
ncbi:MAG: hypothetical protein DMG03_04840 [Acidobacteria bacterium]|nr:MAG: hypothetical protein DMG03_04840 [Acidobacteriota bacterium]